MHPAAPTSHRHARNTLPIRINQDRARRETRKNQHKKNLSAGKLPQFELLNLDFGRLLALTNGTPKVVVCQTRGLHLRCGQLSVSQEPGLVLCWGLGCTYASRHATPVSCSAACPRLDGCLRSGRSTYINVSLYIPVFTCTYTRTSKLMPAHPSATIINDKSNSEQRRNNTSSTNLN